MNILQVPWFMKDPNMFERVIHIPRFVRIALGVLIALFGVVFLLVLTGALFLNFRLWSRDLVLASVLTLLMLWVGTTSVYVGSRLIVLRSDQEPLVRSAASRVLSGGLAATGVASLAAALVGSPHWELYAGLAAILLPSAWFLHTRHTVQAEQSGSDE